MPFTTSLTPEEEKKAKKELNEKKEWRDRDLNTLRDLVVAHKGLTTRTDDEFLIRFLRARKFDYDRAYDMFINYHTMRAQNPDVFKGLTLSSIQHVLDCKISFMLPKPTKDGYRILYFQPGRWNPDAFPMIDMFKVNLFNLEKVVEAENVQVNGIIAIGNMGDLGMNHVKNMDRNYAKLMGSLLQDAFPMRFKGLHVINEPAVFDLMFSIMKQFLKEKTLKRVSFHKSSLSSLHKKVPPELLPEELGGKLGPVDQLAEAWYEEMKAASDRLEKQCSLTIELPRAISNQKAEGVDTGAVTGTFKKLNVD